ncbi:MAG TPA: GNAT family N-acetyltransferase [Leptospiraceae bacterium]|nr:GNAT family N-acetyltransferase [Leptospiraceae bacterium]HMW06941.1 GNAT family N-acetyltransferase [Leptospiraceae bacterium]HMX32302.1 GNAT family N-acetyltransferase [Leptospiraceae bacterium]HMY30591.1 GNAT family N-acetyltransferase [Leptospiraceae bacterium]HMZ66720.1 GNAT family N-acetyltransferase [Leptospiraceae bacterium]
MENFKFRKAKQTDAVKILEIRKEAILKECIHVYPEDIITKWAEIEITDSFLEDLSNDFYLVETRNQIVGTGMIDFSKSRIDAIFVSPSSMRKGVATSMLNYLEKLAREKNLNYLKLESTLNAAPFYRLHGFVGERIQIYKSPRGFHLKCIPMIKELESEYIPNVKSDFP